MLVPELTLVATGRRLAFASHAYERAHIFRRVGRSAGPWHRVAVNARSPFLDEDVLAPGTVVEYYIHVQDEAGDGAPQERSHLLSITT
ncbi:hypothetical protein [Hymenobacter cellulosilyticus]|uniref:Uncharacterized protein n=1 Tax=Hymenobacter cellulosilyticus TaxID=2932248 RepID=A0A8T9QFJ2_9BACT|nr:hypothetical protein [Hymenobacter cellulosilyticus]UOQ75181.1 hypothetical protein MUN79_28750 [Hymenobacter cellulosilyticus]